MEYRERTFEHQDVLLDGNTFISCRFRDCRVIFKATAPVTLGANYFGENVQWLFDGAASATLQFLSALRNSSGKGGPEFVEKVFEQVRSGWL